MWFMDGQTDNMKPVYTPFNFIEAWGEITTVPAKGLIYQ